MIAPKLPSFFKSAPHRKFNLKTRYYDKRKEKIEKVLLANEVKNNKLEFKNQWGPSSRGKSNKNSNKTILLIVLALFFVSYLLLK